MLKYYIYIHTKKTSKSNKTGFISVGTINVLFKPISYNSYLEMKKVTHKIKTLLVCILQLHSCNVKCVYIALEGHNKILIPALYLCGFISCNKNVVTKYDPRPPTINGSL